MNLFAFRGFAARGLIVFALFSVHASTAFASEPEPASPLAIVGATLIDGRGEILVVDSVMLVAGERIVAVGPRDTVKIPSGARVFDASGKWVVPGLIDAHVHFFLSGGIYARPDILDYQRVRPYSDELARTRAQLLETFARYIASGVTSVVDVGGSYWNFDVRRIARATQLAPRVAVAGPLLATRASDVFAVEDPPIFAVESPEHARGLARAQLAHEPDLVKLWLVSKFGHTIDDALPWIGEVIDEANTTGVRVAAHATDLEVARAVVAAGVRVLAHSVMDKPVDDEFIALMKENGVVYTTTLMVYARYQEVFRRNVVLTEIERLVADPDIVDNFDATIGGEKGGRRVRVRTQPPIAPNPIPLANLTRVADAGVFVAAGSDAGNIATPHGPALHRELELMSLAGVDSIRILRAASEGGARVMGRFEDLGTLEPGKLADFLILDKDPLVDIRNTRHIHRVAKGGVLFDPTAILAGLDSPNQTPTLVTE